jgi:hypothetical protein
MKKKEKKRKRETERETKISSNISRDLMKLFITFFDSHEILCQVSSDHVITVSSNLDKLKRDQALTLSLKKRDRHALILIYHCQSVQFLTHFHQIFILVVISEDTSKILLLENDLCESL